MARFEGEEGSGSVTIKTIHRIAENLDCIFVYGFVHRTSLKDTITNQAKKVAVRHLDRAMQTMSLEDQSLGNKESEKVLDNLIDEIIQSPPPNLWDRK